jgi:hypothetical protein
MMKRNNIFHLDENLKMKYNDIDIWQIDFLVLKHILHIGIE